MPAALFVPTDKPSSNHRSRWRLSTFIWVAILALLGVEPVRAAVSLNSEEQKLAQLLTTDSGQRRDRSKMYADERLCQVARSRAMDMAKRRYFDHVNPDGQGPNYLVRQAGYPLPSYYSTSKSANNVESIGCGYSGASACWSGWMGSSSHKTHLLATDPFYRDQTAYGVGYYYESGSPYGRYYVIITAPPAGDTLSITSPTSGARVVTNQMTVTGQVSGADSVAQMVYRLENTAGTGSWQPLPVPSGSGVSNWSTNVGGLALGTNTVRVRTLNSSGSVMKEAARSVRLAVLRPLTVEIDGDGTVTSGFAGITQREVGASYTIRALPKVTALFSHWEGFADSDGRDLRKATQTFTMTEGLVLRAHFIPNPFVTRNGTYEGLVLGGTLDHATTGLLRLSLARTGGFSGLLTLGSSRLSVRGMLNSAGSATVTLVRPGLTNLVLNVQLDLANPTDFLTATLSDGTENWSIQADRKAPVEGDLLAPARRFTFRIDPDTTAPATPQGYGFGVATVTAANTVTISGKLADGRPLAATAGLAANGSIAMYAPQFGRAGAFAATLQIGEDGMLHGDGRWLKPERLTDLRYPAAFSTSNALIGGLYVAPVPGARALAWEPTGNGILTLSSGNLETPLVQALVLGLNQSLTWAIPTIASLQITAQATTGSVSGTFLHPSGATRGFRGVMIQQLGGAWGYFLGETESGAVALQAAGQ
jgi:hypothetical protein